MSVHGLMKSVPLSSDIGPSLVVLHHTTVSLGFVIERMEPEGIYHRGITCKRAIIQIYHHDAEVKGRKTEDIQLLLTVQRLHDPP